MAKAVVVKGRKVRYAVVGIGWISQSSFLPGVEHTGNSEVVAFVSGHEEKAAKVGEKYGVSALYSYEEYDELLSSGTIDAVYLATPNFDHVDLSVRTLKAGIHLLLEKPMAVSVEQCQEIIKASEVSGAKLMIAYRLHHEPGTLKAFEVARSGQAGAITVLQFLFFAAGELPESSGEAWVLGGAGAGHGTVSDQHGAESVYGRANWK